MFSTAGYNLLLSQAATGEEEEEDEWEKTRQMLLAIRHLYCTHPPPFISVRSLSTSSAPSIATSSCKSKGGDFLCKQTTEHRYRYIQKKLLNHSLNVENAIVSSPNHVLFIWLGFAPFLFLLIVSRETGNQGFQIDFQWAHHTSGCLSRSDRVRPCCRISWRACGTKNKRKAQRKEKHSFK